MRWILGTLAAIFAGIYRRLFGSAPPPGAWTPPVIDEVEIFETRLASVLPPGWTLERRDLRPWGGQPDSQPYLADGQRGWVLSTPWPGHDPQRAQVWLFLFRSPGPLSPQQAVLTRWERFDVVAQDPASIRIGNDSFSWTTLPGWPNAKADIVAALA